MKVSNKLHRSQTKIGMILQKMLKLHCSSYLQICVDVISDALDIIGNYIPTVADVLAEYNIYGGCYR